MLLPMEKSYYWDHTGLGAGLNAAFSSESCLDGHQFTSPVLLFSSVPLCWLILLLVDYVFIFVNVFNKVLVKFYRLKAVVVWYCIPLCRYNTSQFHDLTGNYVNFQKLKRGILLWNWNIIYLNPFLTWKKI